MDKVKRNPQLIVIMAILLVTGIALGQKLNSLKPAVSYKVLADEGEDRDEVDEADDEDSDDDENKEDDEDRNENENKDDDDEDSERSTFRTQRVDDDDEDEDDDLEDADDEDDDEDEAGEEIKDISELIAKVEKKISLVAASGGVVDDFNSTLAEVRDLVAQAQAKLAEGDKAGAENLIETADDKLENLEESVKLVLGEREDDDEDEADDDDENRSKLAKEYKNIVAQFVHDLKAAMELEGVEGGIGSQVSVIAQTQNASQERIVETLDRIEERSAVKKFFVGPDLDSLDEVREEIAKNKATIQILTKMLEQTDNVNVQIVLSRQIQILGQENLKLENYITATENVPSLFGWIVRLFD